MTATPRHDGRLAQAQDREAPGWRPELQRKRGRAFFFLEFELAIGVRCRWIRARAVDAIRQLKAAIRPAVAHHLTLLADIRGGLTLAAARQQPQQIADGRILIPRRVATNTFLP